MFIILGRRTWQIFEIDIDKNCQPFKLNQNLWTIDLNI